MRSPFVLRLTSSETSAEVKYVVLRNDGQAAWQAVEALLAVLPITVHPGDGEMASLAADFRSRYKMRLADACAAALAKHLKAVLYTGDAEFNVLAAEIRLQALET